MFLAKNGLKLMTFDGCSINIIRISKGWGKAVFVDTVRSLFSKQFARCRWHYYCSNQSINSLGFSPQ